MLAVNNNFNKCLKIILLIVAPLAIYLSCMSQSLWDVFYGSSEYGSKIIKYTIIVTIFDCLYMVINSLLQSLNKSKLIYVSVITGLLTNLILDIPLMYLFAKLNLPAYYGAITATLLGFLLSNSISIIYLNKEMHLNYRDTIKAIPRFILSVIVLIVMFKGFKMILPIDNPSRMVQVFNLAITGIVCGIVYLLINFKYLKEILPNKIVRMIPLVNKKKEI